jgi:hypothetical protein
MRNTVCGEYSSCLLRAARVERDFDCGGCHRRVEAVPVDLDERFNCCLLLLAVFFPVSYAAHLQDLRKTIQDDASDSEDEIEIPGAWMV